MSRSIHPHRYNLTRFSNVARHFSKSLELHLLLHDNNWITIKLQIRRLHNNSQHRQPANLKRLTSTFCAISRADPSSRPSSSSLPATIIVDVHDRRIDVESIGTVPIRFRSAPTIKTARLASYWSHETDDGLKTF